MLDELYKMPFSAWMIMPFGKRELLCTKGFARYYQGFTDAGVISMRLWKADPDPSTAGICISLPSLRLVLDAYCLEHLPVVQLATLRSTSR